MGVSTLLTLIAGCIKVYNVCKIYICLVIVFFYVYRLSTTRVTLGKQFVVFREKYTLTNIQEGRTARRKSLPGC